MFRNYVLLFSKHKLNRRQKPERCVPLLFCISPALCFRVHTRILRSSMEVVGFIIGYYTVFISSLLRDHPCCSSYVMTLIIFVNFVSFLVYSAECGTRDFVTFVHHLVLYVSEIYEGGRGM